MFDAVTMDNAHRLHGLDWIAATPPVLVVRCSDKVLDSGAVFLQDQWTGYIECGFIPRDKGMMGYMEMMSKMCPLE